MSDVRRYTVWPNPMSRSSSQALESWKSFHFQQLSPPFTTGADNWSRILKLGHNFWCVLVFLCHVTSNVAETSFVKSRPSVPYGANILVFVTALIEWCVCVIIITQDFYISFIKINKVDVLHVRLTDLHAAHQNLPFPPNRTLPLKQYQYQGRLW